MRFLCNYIDRAAVSVIAGQAEAPGGSLFSSGSLVCAGPLEAAAAVLLAEQGLPPGTSYPPTDRPRLGYPSVDGGPVWIEFELPPRLDRLTPPMVAAGSRMGAMLVPGPGGGTAVACFAHQPELGLAMPFPIAWSGEDGIGTPDPGSVSGYAWSARTAARTALRIVGLAAEILRAARLGILTEKAAPDLSHAARSRQRHGKPELLSCRLLEVSPEGVDEDAEDSLGSVIVGWCAVLGAEGCEPDIVPVRELLQSEAAKAYSAERAALGRWALQNPGIGQQELLLRELTDVTVAGDRARRVIAAQLSAAAGLRLFAVASGGRLIPAPDPGAAPGSRQARDALHRWASSLGRS